MGLIGIGMIGNSDYIGTSLGESILEVKKKKATLFIFFKETYIDKDLRTAHWVGHSVIK